MEVVLNPGDVLFVPHRWWHHVENLELAVSVNTWIEIPRDVEGRCKEAIVKTLVNAIMSSTETCEDEDDDYDDGHDAHHDNDDDLENYENSEDGNSHKDSSEAKEEEPRRTRSWINPTESPTSLNDNLKLLNLAMSQFTTPESDLVNSETLARPFSNLIQTCKCVEFTSTLECHQCESRLRGSVLKPGIIKTNSSMNDVSGPKKVSNGFEKQKELPLIDATALVDAITSDDVVQMIFDKLKNRP